MKSFLLFCVLLLLACGSVSQGIGASVENHAGAWFYQNPLIALLEPLSEQGNVYPIFQNGLKTLFGGFLCKGSPDLNARHLEDQFKKSKVAYRKLSCKIPGALQFYATTSGQTHLLTLAPQNEFTQIHLTTLVQDPAFTADFPTLSTQLPEFSSGALLFSFERVLNTGQDLTTIYRLNGSREQALASVTAQLESDGWKSYLPPTEMAPQTAIMLFVKDRQSLFATQIQKDDQIYLLCNLHPKILQPRLIPIP